jgi:hypothetical protein
VLPALEGRALQALIEATAEAQRVAGDELTFPQRRADALATIVNTASGQHQPKHGGLPAAVTLTIPIDDVDRLAGQPGTGCDSTDPTGCAPATDASNRGDACHSGAGSGGCGGFGWVANIGRQVLGDGAARFGLCCAGITPIAVAEPGSLAARLGAAPLEPLAVGREQRFATTAQRKALQVRDRGCVMQGAPSTPPTANPTT